MVRFDVLIPSIGKAPGFPERLHGYLTDPESGWVVVVDNGPKDAHLAAEQIMPEVVSWRLAVRELYKLVIVERPGDTIYAAWNRGIEMARLHAMPCAILNDDVDVEPGALSAAATTMELFPDVALMGLEYLPSGPWADQTPVRYVFGTYRTGGFGGFGFLVSPSCPPCDVGYHWWYGDDDLGQRVLASGQRLAVATRARMRHDHPGTSGGTPHPDDAARFRQAWPGAE